MDNNKIQSAAKVSDKPLKTWDEAIKELAGFIKKTKAEEVGNAKEEA